MSFYRYMKRFRNLDNAMGDLARDMAEDPEFPKIGRKEKEYLRIKQYLIYEKDASDDAMDTFEQAFKIYSNHSLMCIN